MSKNLEFNKICASCLIFCILVLGSSLLIDSLYEGKEGKSKGYKIEVDESVSSNTDGNVIADPFENIDFKQLVADADSSKGLSLFKKKCATCHTNSSDGQNRIGPGLWKVVGRKIGHKDDFNYSKVFQEHGGVWTDEQLFRYIHKPSKYMPGTRMVFAGISDFKQLADLISYLNTLR